MKGDFDDYVFFLSDDEPDGPECTRLHMLFGGNGDYYLSISPSEKPPMEPSVRVCTSGSRDGLFMMLVATMWKLGSGDLDAAAECARAFASLCDMKRKGP